MKDVIVVTSGKGGVGKSTISAMIGLNLSSRGRILLIDADLGLNNLDLLLNVPSSSYDIADVIKGRCELEEAMMKVKENLFILNLCLSSEVRKYPEYLLETIIGQTGDYFDYIIIDSPAGMEQGFLNTLSVATRGIIVLNDELTSYEDGRKIQRLCKIHNRNRSRNISARGSVTISMTIISSTSTMSPGISTASTGCSRTTRNSTI